MTYTACLVLEVALYPIRLNHHILFASNWLVALYFRNPHPIRLNYHILFASNWLVALYFMKSSSNQVKVLHFLWKQLATSITFHKIFIQSN